MRLGVDLGTTRTIVAAVDRGNYPVVSFEDPLGDSHDHVPSVVAWHDGGLVFGHAAVHAAREHRAPTARSFKRLLSAPALSTRTPVPLGEVQVPLLDVMVGFLADLREQVLHHSSVTVADPLEAAVAVPAHASGAQRLLTLHAFRAAGFRVLSLLNEPSAAGFEFSHRHSRSVTSRRTRVVVYDLGGGTFDASLVDVRGTHHDVLASVGLPDLGGDDFDRALAGLASSGAPGADLLEECRDAKERLTPQSRRLVVDAEEGPAVVPVADFYEAATPLVSRTMDAMVPLLDRLDDGDPDLSEVAGLYLVGGGSALPLVPRMLRERFGRRVHSSPHPAASTAIGLAIAADEDSGYSLADRLSRCFGVFREGAEGTEVSFDQLLGREDRLSLDAPVVVERRYRAAHNVGWFRFVEYAHLDADGEPVGALMPFAEVVFPFDPALQSGADLGDVDVVHAGTGPLVSERYVVDPHGLIEVTITDLDTGHAQTHTLEVVGGR